MTYWTNLLGVPFETGYVDVGGIKTRRLVAGQGEPVLFLHGISGHLEAFIPILEKYVDTFEVHLIDMLGHGFTQVPGGPIFPDRLAEHVKNYLDAVGIDKVHIAGISFGGQTAAWLAAHFPDRVRSVTLIAAAGDPDSAQANDPKVMESNRQRTLDGILGNDREATRKRLQMVISNPAAISEEVVDVRHAVYTQPSFQAGAEDLLAITYKENFDKYALTPEVLGRIEAEVLTIWGESDQAIGTLTGFLETGLREVKVVTMKDTGHQPPAERPDDFAKVHKAFLTGGLAAVTAGSI